MIAVETTVNLAYDSSTSICAILDVLPNQDSSFLAGLFVKPIEESLFDSDDLHLSHPTEYALGVSQPLAAGPL